MIPCSNSKKSKEIVKKIKSDELAEVLLTCIVEELSKAELDLTNNTSDGRISSSLLEIIVNEYISKNKKIENTLLKYDVNYIIPKDREWYDLAIKNNDQSIFIPINIKISALSCGDSIGSKKGLYYACTGVIPRLNSITNDTNVYTEDVLRTNRWSEFYTKLLRDVDKEKHSDYYFLILNKKNSSDVFFTSLKSLKTIIPNGNNIPFLCNWELNRQRVKRSHIKARKFLMESLGKSLILANESIALGLDVVGKLS